ncbi:MAG: hypothetical protein NC827_02380 [Candidatus Omnitrophica bacterium]|nr:hypothetical protein [Candidatus Omnitrophota bacterium]MCM8802142.1 hypothetical protein [Candidatus Omnitrophota bacterium]
MGREISSKEKQDKRVKVCVKLSIEDEKVFTMYSTYTKKETKIATVGLGYIDGYPKN